MAKRYLLNKFAETFPISSVDFYIKYKKKYLLAKRNNYPAKNKFACIGGIIKKNESIKKNCNRILKKELKLKASKKLKLININKFCFNTNFCGNKKKTEYVSVGFFLRLNKKEFESIKINKEHSMIKLFTKNELIKNKQVINQLKNAFKSGL